MIISEIIRNERKFTALSLAVKKIKSAAMGELRPLYFAERTLLSSVLDRAFRGEL